MLDCVSNIYPIYYGHPHNDLVCLNHHKPFKWHLALNASTIMGKDEIKNHYNFNKKLYTNSQILRQLRQYYKTPHNYLKCTSNTNTC